MKHSKLLLLLATLFMSLLSLPSQAQEEYTDVTIALTNENLTTVLGDENSATNPFETYLQTELADKSNVSLTITLTDGCTLTDTQKYRIGQGIRNNTKVTTIDLSSISSIATLPAHTFDGCGYLKSINLPSLTSLSDNLFTGCSTLTSLAIGNWSNATDNEGLDMAVIPSGCFQNCSNLTNLYFTNVAEVKGWSFEGCTSMTTFPIKSCQEDKDVEIGQNAFNNTKLTGNIVLPKGIATIKGSSFASCKDMKTITLPITIKSVDPEFDINSTALTHIYMEGDNAEVNFNNYYLTSGGILYVINGSNLMVARCPIANPEPIVIPAIISEKAVTEIGAKAFHDCAMTGITLAEGLLKIDDAAFINCKALNSLTIPASVTDIATNFVNECQALATLSVATGNTKYYTSNNITYTKRETDSYYNIFRVPEAATFDNGVLDLSNINDAEHVTGVGKEAFHGVKNAETIKLPDAITALADECFKQCGVKTFYVPKSLTEEGFGLAPFSECDNLTQFAPPSTQLDHFYIDQYGILYNKEYNKLFKVPNNYELKFNDESRKGTFDIFHFVKEVQACAFEGVKNIKTVNFTQGIKKVPHRCFYNAKSVETVLIPNSVTEFGQDAFMGSSVKNVIVLTTTETAPKSQNANFNSFYGINNEFEIHLSESNEYGNFKSKWVEASENFRDPGTTNTQVDDDTKLSDTEKASRDYGWYGLNQNKRLVEDIKHRAIFENSANIAGFNGTDDNNILNDADQSNNLTAQHYDYITLYRDFSTMQDDEYATLALPVDVTKATFIAAFGEKSKVWAFDGRNNMTLNFKSVDMNNMADNDLVIKKGIAVLIRPDYKENSYLLQMNLGGENAENNAIAINENKATSYISDTESDNEETIVTTSDNFNFVNGEMKNDVTFKYGFYATYQPKASMRAGSYYMKSDGSFMFAKNSLKISKAFRGFICGNDDAIGGDATAPAKLSFDGFTTGIDDVVIDGNDHKAYDIYNANGQLVRKNTTSTDGLAKGLYIMNGKKVIVR